MFRPLIETLKSIATGAPAAAAPRRLFEIAPEVLPRDIAANGTVSFRKVAARDLGAAVAVPAHAGADADIDIWVLPHDGMTQFLDAQELLSADERAHAERIRHETHRVRFIAVRVLLRRALSQRVDGVVAAADWRFVNNRFGKPELAAGQANCSFSITHAEGFSVIAVAANSTIGIDAERVDAERVKHLPVDLLSQNEKSGLDASSARNRYGDFFRLWTLKEAYTKALGLGMSLDFSKLDFCARTAQLRDGAGETGNAQFGILNLKYLGQKYLLTVCMLGSSLASLVGSHKNIFIVEAIA